MAIDVYISKSSLQSYVQCPKRFEFAYLKGFRTPKSAAMQRGLDVHEFVNQFYDHIYLETGSLIVDPNFLEDFLDNSVETAHPLIKNFVDFEVNRWQICQAIHPENPQKIFLPLARERKFVSDRLEQVVIIDRLDSRIDGNYTLIEIKSGKFRDKPWKKTELRREMTFEKITAESSAEFQREFPNDIVDFVVYFPRSNDVMMENFHWRTLKSLQRHLSEMRENIEQNEFPCNVRYHCRFCDFRYICPMMMD